MSSHTRHFIDVGGRRVHYRRAGAGPPVVLLHACPKSSLEQAPLLDRLRDRFCALAFDMPGHGESDPLPLEQPEVPDFADGLAKTLTTLGIERFALYGRHTGSLIALELAQRAPKQIVGAIYDGFPVFTEEEANSFLDGYLAPLPLFWDGIHVTAVWARVRENYMLFPWHRLDNTVRPDIDLPPPTMLHEVATDILRLGDRWRVGYAAAFRYRLTPEALAAVDHPVTIMARRDDLLYPHLDRLPKLPSNYRIEPHSFDVGRWATRIRELVGGWADTLPAAPPPVEPSGGVGMVGDVGRQVRVLSVGEGRPLVALHDVPGWSNDLVARIRTRVTGRRIVAADLPGCGLSDALPGSNLEELTSVVSDALIAAGVDKFDVYAEGLSAVVALRLAKQLGSAVGFTILNGPPIATTALSASDYSVDRTPKWDGTHLMTLWMALRDEELYWPWFNRRRDGIISRTPPRDAEALHRRFVGALLSQNDASVINELLSVDVHNEIAEAGKQLELLAEPGTRFSRAASNAANNARAFHWPSRLLPWNSVP